MNKELLDKFGKFLEVNDKVSAIANMWSWVEGIKKYEEIGRLSAAAATVQPVNGSLIRLNELMLIYGGSDLVPHSPQRFAPKSFSQINSVKFYGGSWPECLLTSRSFDISSSFKSFSQLDFLSDLYQKDIDFKKKSEAQLINSISFVDIDSISIDSIDFGKTQYKYISSQKLKDSLHDLALSLIVQNEKRSTDLDWENLRKIIEVLGLREEIKEKQKFVKFVKSLRKLICSVFRQFQINRRERFRKINSFLFKNLDDYHSLALASTGY